MWTFALVLFCLLSQEALAYMDPSVQGLLWQGLSVCVIAVSFYARRIVRFFKDLVFRKKHEETL